MSQIMTIPYNDQEIGQGYNTNTHEAIGTALTVKDVSEDPNADGMVVTTAFETVSTQESLMSSLGLSVGLDARYGLFSADAKMSFAEQHSVNSSSTFIAGKCTAHNAVRHGHGFDLTPAAQKFLAAEQMDQFKEAFGDMFVRSMNTGGEFLVIARITSESEEAQNSLAASLQASYNGLVAGGDFQAKFNEAQQNTKSQTQVDVWCLQAGGVDDQQHFTGIDAAKILEKLSAFPTFVHQHPVAYEIELASYDTIPLPVPTVEELEDRELVLADCLQQKMRFLKAKADLQLALDPTCNFFFENLPAADQLATMLDQYDTALNGLMAHAIKVSKGEMNPPAVYIANPAPPSITFKRKPFTEIPSVSVPNVFGMEKDDAAKVVSGAGLNFVFNFNPTTKTLLSPIPITFLEAASNCVWRVSPGGNVSKGSLVTLFIHP